VSLQKWKTAILILKCYISLNLNTADGFKVPLRGFLNPSAMLKFRDKGVSESIYNVKI